MTGVGLWVTAKEPSRRVDPAVGWSLFAKPRDQELLGF